MKKALLVPRVLVGHASKERRAVADCTRHATIETAFAEECRVEGTLDLVALGFGEISDTEGVRQARPPNAFQSEGRFSASEGGLLDLGGEGLGLFQAMGEFVFEVSVRGEADTQGAKPFGSRNLLDIDGLPRRTVAE